MLVLLAFAVYWPCLNGPFLWDDRNWSTGIEWLLRDPDGWWRVWTEVRLLEQPRRQAMTGLPSLFRFDGD